MSQDVSYVPCFKMRVFLKNCRQVLRVCFSEYVKDKPHYKSHITSLAFPRSLLVIKHKFVRDFAQEDPIVMKTWKWVVENIDCVPVLLF